MKQFLKLLLLLLALNNVVVFGASEAGKKKLPKNAIQKKLQESARVVLPHSSSGINQVVSEDYLYTSIDSLLSNGVDPNYTDEEFTLTPLCRIYTKIANSNPGSYAFAPSSLDLVALRLIAQGGVCNKSTETIDAGKKHVAQLAENLKKQNRETLKLYAKIPSFNMYLEKYITKKAEQKREE